MKQHSSFSTMPSLLSTERIHKVKQVDKNTNYQKKSFSRLNKNQLNERETNSISESKYQSNINSGHDSHTQCLEFSDFGSISLLSNQTKENDKHKQIKSSSALKAKPIVIVGESFKAKNKEIEKISNLNQKQLLKKINNFEKSRLSSNSKSSAFRSISPGLNVKSNLKPELSYKINSNFNKCELEKEEFKSNENSRPLSKNSQLKRTNDKLTIINNIIGQLTALKEIIVEEHMQNTQTNNDIIDNYTDKFYRFSKDLIQVAKSKKDNNQSKILL